MSEPELPGQFPAAIISAIRRRLDVARASGVSIAFAIESGSRAWGFPSPDSDFDCRFVYVRPSADHLALTLHRDVIEFPVTTELDVGGWDLRKALKLALKGNAVIYEWVVRRSLMRSQMGSGGVLRPCLKKLLIPKR